MSQIALFFLSPLLKMLTLSTIIGAAGIALYLLTPSWFPGRFRNTALIVGVGALCAGSAYWWAFHAGEKHMVQKIAARDRASIARIDEGAREVLGCNDGVDWDVTVGACRPGSGAGASQ